MLLSQAVFMNNKCIMTTEGGVCQTTRELLASELFVEITKRYIGHLYKHNSVLLAVFGNEPVNEDLTANLIKTLQLLGEFPIDQLVDMFLPAGIFIKHPNQLDDFVEGLYNYWRSYDRFLICYSETGKYGRLEARPYRVFNDTVEQLAHLVRAAYRDVKENITGRHCRIYRQVRAGSHVGLIAVEKSWPCPSGSYADLQSIPMIRQILLNPPLIIDPPMNKRTGQFQQVKTNPLEGWEANNNDWLCYPAKVGPLLIHIFFHRIFMELGCSLANLFELAEDEDLNRKPDAIYTFGAPAEVLSRYGQMPTVFFDDLENDILVGAVPDNLEFGYFGYLKKMTLTLHNIVMMKRGRLPYHGAMVRVLLKNGEQATILLVGDTGAGKSETLEAFRILSDEHVRDLIIIADDMGSLEIDSSGRLLGYGTETGAFVRLDDLQPGYALGQIDRAIIMSPQKINARAVLPITTLANVLHGYHIDFLLYANNYEEVDDDHPIIEPFLSKDDALRVFREGAVMSKGTTTTTGLVHTYFANVFGPAQYKEIHDHLAGKYFQTAFDSGVFVGQIRTRLGIAGWEAKGPTVGAQALFELISSL